MPRLGKPLPKVSEVVPPSNEELDKVNARWDAFCPPYYRGLLDAQSVNAPNPTAAFLYDRANVRYIHRKTKRVLTNREVLDAYIAYSRKMRGK